MSFLRATAALFGRLVASLALAVLLTCASVFSARASVTSAITYQARLWTAAGAQVVDGTYSMKFSIYSASSGGTPVWTAAGLTGSPSAVVVPVSSGGFTVNLGDTDAGQNSLAGVDWSSSSLYLGVTIGLSDSEMTPRRRITAVPQAFLADNAMMLQGMSASSTAYGTQTLFTIHQTEGSAATGTRSVLDVRSEGTSNVNDYLFRGINDLGATVFALNRNGNVTSTGALFVNAPSATSTILGNILLGTSTRDTVLPPLFAMDGDDALVAGDLGVASSVHSLAGVYVGSANTFYGAGAVRASGNYAVESDLVISLRGNGGQSSVVLGSYATIRGNSGIVLDQGGGDIVPVYDLSASLGNGSYRFNGYFGTVTSSVVTVADSQAGTSTLRATNLAAASGGTAWGAYTNRLLVGQDTAATGTAAYVSVFAYDSSGSYNGACFDNLNTAANCPDFNGGSVYSIVADDAIGASAFDLAERYTVSGPSEPGDLLVLDPDHPMQMKLSSGIPYDPGLSGIVSTRPGFILGVGGTASVALSGRVPLKVTVSNGAIRPGDALTSSDHPGIAMKATRAGTIVGRALEAADADGMIEVFVQPGFDASPLLQADGSLSVIAQDLGLQSQAVATADAPARGSRALTFRGSAWDGGQAVVSEFRLFNDVRSPTNAALTITNGTSSALFALSRNGSLELSGDLALAGRLYPSARGRAQHESYVFVDDTEPGSPYISTNADGWQSLDGYDYAERYPSPDPLEPGDLVVVHRSRRVYVQRSLNDREMLVGIVSTKPGFVAGRPDEDVYPIALAGRVPTKVSSVNGAIEAGDPLAASSIPGVAVKATKPGPIVGLALEPYAASDIGKIEVFVNPTWWGGTGAVAVEGVGETSGPRRSARGFAEIVLGQTRVHVSLPEFVRYPHLDVTPYAQTEQGWWIDRVSASGFDLVLGGPPAHGVRFSWKAEEAGDDELVSLPSGQRFALDPVSGQIVYPPGVGENDPPASTVVPAPAASIAESGEEEEGVDLEAATSSAAAVEPLIDEPSGTEVPSSTSAEPDSEVPQGDAEPL